MDLNIKNMTEEQMADIEVQIAKRKAELAKPKSIFDIKKDEYYYCIEPDGVLSSDIHDSNLADDKIIRQFATTSKEQAEAELWQDQFRMEIAKWKHENDDFVPDWGNAYYHYIYYIHDDDTLDVGSDCAFQHGNTDYFSSQDNVKLCIKTLGKVNWIRYITYEFRP